MQISISKKENQGSLLPNSLNQTNHGRNNRTKLHRTKTEPLSNSNSSNPRAVLSNTKSVLPFVSKRGPTLYRIAMVFVIYLGVGLVSFLYFDHEMDGKKTKRVVDALYFCIVTMTGVGYGDIVPVGIVTKLLTCAFVFSGIALVGFLVSSAADYLVEKQERLLIKALSARRKNPSTKFIAENKTKTLWGKILVLIMIMIMMFVTGVVVLHVVEKLSILDSFYGICCTITTLGYGDVSFQTEAGRIFAVIWIPVGTVCLARLFLHLAEIRTVGRQQALVHWVINRRTTAKDLEAADLDSDGVLSPAEFVLYKLKEMGKIDGEDVELILREFEHLDVDQSGTISKSDLRVVESLEN